METRESGSPGGDRPETTQVEVEINDLQGHLAVDHQALQRLARRVFEAEGVQRACVSIVLVDDATIHDVNRRFLGHDWPTDVIGFPLSEPGDSDLHGELIVSAERALVTARAMAGDPWTELALYVVHGLLHWCGFDDQTAEDAATMRRRESLILAREGLIPPFSPEDIAGASGADRESTPWPV